MLKIKINKAYNHESKQQKCVKQLMQIFCEKCLIKTDNEKDRILFRSAHDVLSRWVLSEDLWKDDQPKIGYAMLQDFIFEHLKFSKLICCKFVYISNCKYSENLQEQLKELQKSNKI